VPRVVLGLVLGVVQVERRCSASPLHRAVTSCVAFARRS
jgi:hypothetical protein